MSGLGMQQNMARNIGMAASMGMNSLSRLARQMRRGAVVLACAMGLATMPALAQTANRASFSPVKYVNNQAVTAYELDQRMAFLRLLGFTGDVRAEAMSGLIDDRLRQSTAKALGIGLSNEAVVGGMEEFAARGNLNAQQFLQAIGEQGIAPETFRDFVSAGLVWRDVVATRFGDGVVISEAAIDRALTNLNVPEAQTVTLSEIVLDASGARRNQALAAARGLEIDFIKGRTFADAARAVSIGPTARSGGRLPPKLLSELDITIAVLVRVLNPGQISKPIVMDDRLYIYQMQESAIQPVAQDGAKVVDYAEVTLPRTGDAAANLATLRRNVDNCDALYAQDGIAVQRRTDGVAGDVAGVLQTLDAGEMAGPLMRGGAAMAVMLCARGLSPTTTASRDEVRLLLKNQRLSALADVYLSELRADALIRDP